MEDVSDWQQRIDALWAAIDELGETEFLSRMNALAQDRAADDPLALFEQGGAPLIAHSPAAAVAATYWASATPCTAISRTRDPRSPGLSRGPMAPAMAR